MADATYEAIASTKLTTAANSISFANIPNTYTDLRVVIYALEGSYPKIRLNNIFQNLYFGVYGGGSRGGTYAGQYKGQSYMYSSAAGSTDGSSPFVVQLDIPSYARTNNLKSALLTCGVVRTTSSTAIAVSEVHAWSVENLLAAIHTVTVLSAVGNFALDTTVTIYGIKRA